MNLKSSRNCPLCDAKAKGISFPFATRFNNIDFDYLECSRCASVFVNPAPDDETFSRMYAKSNYHDQHYEGIDDGAYRRSAKLLKTFLPNGSTVLDYGCGTGAFLKALSSEGFEPFGVEFDQDAAQFAGRNAGCKTLSINEFSSNKYQYQFDAIHLGDVLEHLPDPRRTIVDLLKQLKPNGILFVEGPLETNASPVFWSARLFGSIKRKMRPKLISTGAPTHLFRTNAKQQLEFFLRTDPNLELRRWQVYETGWPYAQGGRAKRSISKFAIFLSGKKLFGKTFGNRFSGIFMRQIGCDSLVQSVKF